LWKICILILAPWERLFPPRPATVGCEVYWVRLSAGRGRDRQRAEAGGLSCWLADCSR